MPIVKHISGTEQIADANHLYHLWKCKLEHQIYGQIQCHQLVNTPINVKP